LQKLQSKGLSASQTPDLIVNLKASHKKIEDIRDDRPYGMWGWGLTVGAGE
jgi:hypothetical protein